MPDIETSPVNFIRSIIGDDMMTGKFDGRVHTRFPPEPNGYLHIGHAKSILLNFGLAQAYNGLFNLRFDDTNPTKEEEEYVESIQEDVKWLGGNWEDRLFYASDYFEQMYQYAVKLIKDGLAYICDLSAEEMRQYRGTLTQPGKDSPYRSRTIEENLDLFARMRNGEFPDGSRTLRAKIDMASPNLNMRDPVMYRILHAAHHRTGDAWCIYPMYDYAHCVSDSIEKITHSVCTLEFEDHRPLYDWFLDQLGIYHSQQIEFARLNLTYTVMSKRKLLRLVKEGIVSGWNDPRMPTLSGMRRRGYTPQAIRAFCDIIGVAKTNSIVEFELLEHTLRQDLELRARRAMAVLDPLKLVIENYPAGKVEEFDVLNNPQNPEDTSSRKVPFSGELFIEREDFMENPPNKYFRLYPGAEVRLFNAYLVKCTGFIKDELGNIVEVRCVYDPETRGGNVKDGRKVKGTIHWVSANHAVDAEVRLYEHLFSTANPDDAPEGVDFTGNINPSSLLVLHNCKLEPDLQNAHPEDSYQFMRKGYFCLDKYESTSRHMVFNRTISLRDTWAKIQQKISSD